jgi:hypothetical protein
LIEVDHHYVLHVQSIEESSQPREVSKEEGETIHQAASVQEFSTYSSDEDYKLEIYCAGDIPDCSDNSEKKYFD